MYGRHQGFSGLFLKEATYTDAFRSGFQKDVTINYLVDTWGAILAHGGINGSYPKAKAKLAAMAKQLKVDAAKLEKQVIDLWNKKNG